MKSNPISFSMAFSLLILLTTKLYSQTPFITTWQITEANESIEIPTKVDSFYIYDYEVEWGDGNITTGHTRNATHTYADSGTYQVSISGIFPAIYFSDSDYGNRRKIISIDLYGVR